MNNTDNAEIVAGQNQKPEVLETPEAKGLPHQGKEMPPQQPVIESEDYALDKAAWAWYMNPNALGSRFRPRNYVTLEEMERLSTALDRSLTLEEVQLLIVSDGDPAKCSMPECKFCENGTFQPVRWAIITKKMLEEVKEKGSIAEEMIFYVGQSIPRYQSGKILAFCGAPYQYNKERSFLSRGHIVDARDFNKDEDDKPRWGLPTARAKESLERHLTNVAKSKMERTGELQSMRELFESPKNNHSGRSGRDDRRKDNWRNRK